MNNSERGKYYRKKYKVYEDGLEASVASLSEEITRLQSFVRLQTELAAQANLAQCAGSMVTQIYHIIARADATTDCESGETVLPSARFGRSDLSTSIPSFASDTQAPSRIPSIFGLRNRNHSASLWGCLPARHTRRRFEMHTFEVSGGGGERDGSATILLQGEFHAQYSAQALAEMHPHILLRHDLVARLADKQVRFPTTLQFCFQPGGALQRHDGECDLVHGLYSALQSLDDVNFVLSSSSSNVVNGSMHSAGYSVITDCRASVQDQPREPKASERWQWTVTTSRPDARVAQSPVPKFSHAQ